MSAHTLEYDEEFESDSEGHNEVEGRLEVLKEESPERKEDSRVDIKIPDSHDDYTPISSPVKEFDHVKLLSPSSALEIFPTTAKYEISLDDKYSHSRISRSTNSNESDSYFSNDVSSSDTDDASPTPQSPAAQDSIVISDDEEDTGARLIMSSRTNMSKERSSLKPQEKVVIIHKPDDTSEHLETPVASTMDKDEAAKKIQCLLRRKQEKERSRKIKDEQIQRHRDKEEAARRLREEAAAIETEMRRQQAEAEKERHEAIIKKREESATKIQALNRGHKMRRASKQVIQHDNERKIALAVDIEKELERQSLLNEEKLTELASERKIEEQRNAELEREKAAIRAQTLDRSRHDVDIGRAIIVRDDENIAKFDLLHQKMESKEKEENERLKLHEIEDLERAEREKAAVRIQAVHRGKNDRRKSKLLRLEQDSKMRETKEKELMEIRSRELKHLRDKDLLKAEHKGSQNQGERTTLINTDQAATKIQKLARRRKKKKNSNSNSSDGRVLLQAPDSQEKVILSVEAAGNLEINGACADASQSKPSPIPRKTPRKSPRLLAKETKVDPPPPPTTKKAVRKQRNSVNDNTQSADRDIAARKIQQMALKRRNRDEVKRIEFEIAQILDSGRASEVFIEQLGVEREKGEEVRRQLENEELRLRQEAEAEATRQRSEMDRKAEEIRETAESNRLQLLFEREQEEKEMRDAEEARAKRYKELLEEETKKRLMEEQEAEACRIRRKMDAKVLEEERLLEEQQNREREKEEALQQVLLERRRAFEEELKAIELAKIREEERLRLDQLNKEMELQRAAEQRKKRIEDEVAKAEELKQQREMLKKEEERKRVQEAEDEISLKELQENEAKRQAEAKMNFMRKAEALAEKRGIITEAEAASQVKNVSAYDYISMNSEREAPIQPTKHRTKSQEEVQIDYNYQRYIEEKELEKALRNHAAIVMQSRWRVYRAKKRLREMFLKHEAQQRRIAALAWEIPIIEILSSSDERHSFVLSMELQVKLELQATLILQRYVRKFWKNILRHNMQRAMDKRFVLNGINVGGMGSRISVRSSRLIRFCEDFLSRKHTEISPPLSDVVINNESLQSPIHCKVFFSELESNSEALGKIGITNMKKTATSVNSAVDKNFDSSPLTFYESVDPAPLIRIPYKISDRTKQSALNEITRHISRRSSSSSAMSPEKIVLDKVRRQRDPQSNLKSDHERMRDTSELSLDTQLRQISKIHRNRNSILLNTDTPAKRRNYQGIQFKRKVSLVEKLRAKAIQRPLLYQHYTGLIPRVVSTEDLKVVVSTRKDDHCTINVDPIPNELRHYINREWCTIHSKD